MNRTRLLCASACFVILGLTLSSLTVYGGDKKKPNATESPKGSKQTDKTKAMEDLTLASKLIQYGRANKHAESLLIAAQILHNNPSAKLDVGSKASDVTKVVKAPAVPDDSPKALVAEAKKLSSSPAVAALAEATLKVIDEAPRGPTGGPMVDNFTIQPGQVINWNPTNFVGLQKATIFVDNRVFGNMLLEVFDEFGNRVAFDGAPGTYFSCSWTPAFNGPFRIRLTNRDTIAFNCVMRAY